MLDKLSRRLLKYLNESEQNPGVRQYDFGDDLWRISEELNANAESVRAAVRFLESKNYLKFSYSGQHAIGFYLDHKGLHWKEFRRQEVLRYLEDKWIDFFALAVAFAALIISLKR